jgi:4-diphosphocytidyl-2-C-methyl-D-erythritol kinase
MAAGLGGGSADAAAVLRLAAGEVEGLAELAAELGADVPSQLVPAPALVSGAGELVERLAPPREFAALLIPSGQGLSTAEVYAEADRLGLGRDRGELENIEARLREAAAGGLDPLREGELLVNDLERAALSLRPVIGEALDTLRDAGALVVALTGSGPTAFGLFEDLPRADAVASALPARHSDVIVATPDAAATTPDAAATTPDAAATTPDAAATTPPEQS